MGKRALGINAVMRAGFEAANSYGTPPAAGSFFKMPFVSSQLGEERPLIEDDQLGFGREGLDPTYDVATNAGDLVVPMDTRAIGFWLKLLFGAPVSAVVTAPDGNTPGVYTHTFGSGASSLPSASIELGLPEVPDFAMHYGGRLNTFKTSMSRSGMLNATLSMIAQGELPGTDASAAAAASVLHGPRFAQASGSISMNGQVIGGVTSADLAYTNNLETVETIRSDGRIEDVDPGKAATTGTLNIKYSSRAYRAQAESQEPVEFAYGWTKDAASLIFTIGRVFLPKTKNAIEGPKGIVAKYDFQASGADGQQLVAVLTNDVADY